MSIDTSRRLYKAATVTGASSNWRIALDGKEIKTPARRDLILKSRGLAEAIAEEWAAQEAKVRPHTMPLMQISSTAIDRVGPERPRIVTETAGYAETDLICYRAEGPADLISRQVATWDPLLDWVRERFDVSLRTASGVMAVVQPESALKTLRRVVEAQDDFHLTALAVLVGATGSLAIGLAVLEKRLSSDEAIAAAQLDELYQAERWGGDPEAEVRRAGQGVDIAQARRFLDLLEAGES
ncbi:MAG TPA: ATP12 family protein [Dongiaceae bacterium]